MDFLRPVHGDRYRLHPLAHQMVRDPVQQSAVGLEMHHEAPPFGRLEEFGKMRVEGGFAAGEVELGPEGGHLIQKPDPVREGQLPARVIPTQACGAGGVAMLLAHDALQVATAGEVEI
jgi:hypothetical protein